MGGVGLVAAAGGRACERGRGFWSQHRWAFIRRDTPDKPACRWAFPPPADVVNRIHVAVPKARDGVVRPPVIPPGVVEARARRDAGQRRQTEKDLQEENGGAGVYNSGEWAWLVGWVGG